ncbi:hypothetical protein PCCS19_35670 [Paenibacillus sp. CCS19]|uniref:WD40/YVTN/BNR-like repeat-containing protein n=1 Tax=Paenibacillus sp. CCS19 TaxID=3158387 RepID=UPI00256CD0F6|nr:hypothetical protein [Paenibacillus cellulosilyticus]GMK40511.1 hypothetical protein PCCS19_35670 [Paenibacillus cellulosilyticus]
MSRYSSLFVVSALVIALLSGCQSNVKDTQVRTQQDEITSGAALEQGQPQSNSSDSKEEAPVSEREETFFLNDQLGWKATYSFYGMHREDMVLSKTVDGGSTWLEIARSDNADSVLPGGVKSGIVFLNESRGWITTNAPWDGTVGLFITNDGGQSWKEQALEVPADFEQSQLFVYPPLFLSTEEGILVTKPESESSLIYLTVDGGNHWEPIANEKEGMQHGISWSLAEDGIYTIGKDATWSLNTSGSGVWSKN